MITHTPPPRLALGSVQFGMPYGVANRDGQVSRDEVEKILKLGKNYGVNTIDTAIGYGDSEDVLGGLGVSDWNIITKVPAIPGDQQNIDQWIRSELTGSLKRLGVERISGLLLHRPLQLLEPAGETIFKTLTALKKDGVVGKIGFSIYSPDELTALWDTFRPDLVQAPFNVFDRRLESSGWLKKMHAAKVEIHTRSAFLQGLLLMNETERPAKFDRWANLWSDWHRWLKEQRASPLQASLSFSLSQPEITRVIVGVDSMSQLNQIINAAKIKTEIPPSSISSEDENLLNPAKWNAQ